MENIAQFSSNIEEKKQEALIDSQSATTPESLESFRVKYLGKDGILKAIAAVIKEIPAEERKSAGEMINQFKQYLEGTYERIKHNISPKPDIIITEEKKSVNEQKNDNKNKHVREKVEWREPTHKREPDYVPGEHFWIMMDKKAVECRLGSITIEHTVNAFSITYNGYYSREAVGTVVAGMPDAAPISVKENRMFKTKELLLASL